MESVLLFALGVVVFIIGLVVSVALHEAGHLTFAKLFGVRVTQYMVGFGKTLWSIRRGGTEYGVKPILLGGYIAMKGMYPPAADETEARSATTGIAGNLFQDGPAGDRTEGGDFYLLAPWKRIIVMAAGPVVNLLIGVVISAVMVMGFGSPLSVVSSLSSCVAATSGGDCSGSSSTPAKSAGLRTGDVVMSIDGLSAPTPDQITSRIRERASRPVTLVIERDGERRTVTITPAAQKAGRGSSDEVGVIGVAVGQRLVPQPISAVPDLVGRQLSASAGVILNLPQRLVAVWNAAFGSAERETDGPIGLIGVGRAVGTVSSLTGVPAADKVYVILGILASLNIGLFVLNMVPLLPLDGGHIAGALWEMLKRGIAKVFRRPPPRPVDITKLMPLTIVVVILLGGMTVLLAYADIVHPISLF